MRLSYRGRSYETSELQVDLIPEGVIVGQYRGVPMLLRRPGQTAPPHPELGLKYRGAWVR